MRSLKELIEEAHYRLASTRTWEGMKWGPPMADPRKQQLLLDILEEVKERLDKE